MERHVWLSCIPYWVKTSSPQSSCWCMEGMVSFEIPLGQPIFFRSDDDDPSMCPIRISSDWKFQIMNDGCWYQCCIPPCMKFMEEKNDHPPSLVWTFPTLHIRIFSTTSPNDIHSLYTKLQQQHHSTSSPLFDYNSSLSNTPPPTTTATMSMEEKLQELNKSWNYLPSNNISSCAESLSRSYYTIEEQEESNTTHNHHHNNNIQQEFQTSMSLLFPIKRPTNSTTNHQQEEWIQSIRSCLQQERNAIRTKHQMAFLPTRNVE